MKITIAEAKIHIVETYERTGRVEVEAWVEQLPEAAVELLDFAFALQGSPRQSESQQIEWIDEHGVAVNSLFGACAVLEDPVAAIERALGEELAAVRDSNINSYSGKAQPPFKRAAVNAWVVDKLRGDKLSVSRLAAQKTTYLLERAMSLGLFTEHQQMRLGPYDPTSRYKDAEPIGKSQRWIDSRGYEILAGPEIQAVYRFAPNYLRAPQIAERFVRLLSERSPWELETWATVEAASCELHVSGQIVTTETIRSFLAGSEIWAGKLRRSNFSNKAIKEALNHLERLRLIPEHK